MSGLAAGVGRHDHYLHLAGAQIVATDALVAMHDNLAEVLEARAMMCVHGDAGLGKTLSVNASLRQLAPGSTFGVQFRARPTPRDIRHVLFDALGLGGIRGLVDGSDTADGPNITDTGEAGRPDGQGPEQAARRAADLRHVAVAALAASDEAVARAHDVHGATWPQLGHALGLASSAVPRLRARHWTQKPPAKRKRR